jgi:hypothetical protein
MNTFLRILRWGICVGVASASSLSASAAPPEYVVKTAFIYNFFKFTDWPVVSGAQDIYNLCFVGKAEQYGDALAALEGKVAAGKILAVHRDMHGDALKNCHMVVVSESDGVEVLRQLDALPVVTVSDMAGFIHRGGMIGLVQNDKRLGFEVNLDIANANNIHFSSQMLKLAKSVKGAK